MLIYIYKYLDRGVTMGKIIAIANQKGGIGKSTTALALSEIIGQTHKVLLIDFDAQGNTTYASGVEPGQKTVTDVLSGEPVEQAIVKAKYYDIIPSDQYLGNVERSENVAPTLIRDSIASLREKYDYIILDTPPALGNLMFGALTAADFVIIPSEARPFSIQGLAALYDTIKSVQKANNTQLKILGILLIKYHSRTVLNRDIRDMIADYAENIETKIFNTYIRESIAVPEAQIQQIPLIDYAAKCNACKDFISLTNEILKEIGEK